MSWKLDSFYAGASGVSLPAPQPTRLGGWRMEDGETASEEATNVDAFDDKVEERRGSPMDTDWADIEEGLLMDGQRRMAPGAVNGPFLRFKMPPPSGAVDVVSEEDVEEDASNGDMGAWGDEVQDDESGAEESTGPGRDGDDADPRRLIRRSSAMNMLRRAVQLVATERLELESQARVSALDAQAKVQVAVRSAVDEERREGARMQSILERRLAEVEDELASAKAELASTLERFEDEKTVLKEACEKQATTIDSLRRQVSSKRGKEDDAAVLKKTCEEQASAIESLRKQVSSKRRKKDDAAALKKTCEEQTSTIESLQRQVTSQKGKESDSVSMGMTSELWEAFKKEFLESSAYKGALRAKMREGHTQGRYEVFRHAAAYGVEKKELKRWFTVAGCTRHLRPFHSLFPFSLYDCIDTREIDRRTAGEPELWMPPPFEPMETMEYQCRGSCSYVPFTEEQIWRKEKTLLYNSSWLKLCDSFAGKPADGSHRHRLILAAARDRAPGPREDHDRARDPPPRENRDRARDPPSREGRDEGRRRDR